MDVFFVNKHNIERKIGSAETKEEAYKTIDDFCEERNFTIHYTRCWEKNGTTTVDVGSHYELFKIIE